MKKLIAIAIAVLCLTVSGNCFAAWTYKIKRATSVDGHTLFVDVEYTNGTKFLNVNIPVWNPQSKADVVTAIKNRFQSEKAAYLAQIAIENNVKPVIDSEVGNIQPTE